MNQNAEREIDINMNRHCIDKYEVSLREDEHCLRVMRDAVLNGNTGRGRVSFGDSRGNIIPDDEGNTSVCFIIKL